MSEHDRDLEFLAEYEELCNRHERLVWSCGCCQQQVLPAGEEKLADFLGQMRGAIALARQRAVLGAVPADDVIHIGPAS